VQELEILPFHCKSGNADYELCDIRTDPALLRVTLLFSAWQLLTLQGKPPTSVVMYHKAESIRWMNKYLRKSNNVATDATIACAACLMKFEVFIQDYIH
jgi:hypothetical protein